MNLVGSVQRRAQALHCFTVIEDLAVKGDQVAGVEAAQVPGRHEDEMAAIRILLRLSGKANDPGSRMLRQQKQLAGDIAIIRAVTDAAREAAIER